MTAKTANNKHSAKKKLIPAVGMLLASAMALSSSTYAWFTMSREVEVSNIQMTATVPEDIQISLGQIGTIGTDGTITASTSEASASLLNGKGGLVNNSGVVTAPTNNWDWSNIADVSEYYQFGTLIPASSTTGANIYFTPNANGVGQTIAKGAAFYAANTAILTAGTDSSVGGSSTTNKLSATAHIINKKNGGIVDDTWGAGTASYTNGAKYTTSTGWNTTNDDGYYIDIPVWLRTSSSSGAKLSVLAYVKPKTTTQKNSADGDALYRAVRVAIIEDVVSGTGQSATTTPTTHGLLPITDGWNVSTNGTDAGTLKANPFQLTKSTYAETILDWYGRTVDTGASLATAYNITTGAETGATAAVASVGGTGGTVPTYGPVTICNPFTVASDANVVATLAAPAATDGVKSAQYGTPTKITIRVWLEGEDTDCWNDTAGQDWSINLKFNNETTNPTASDATTVGSVDVPGVNTSTAPHQS